MTLGIICEYFIKVVHRLVFKDNKNNGKLLKRLILNSKRKQFFIKVFIIFIIFNKKTRTQLTH